MLGTINRVASRIPALPGLNLLSPAARKQVSEADRAGYLRCQELAQAAAREIAGFLREGWTEQQAASLMNTYLQDHGVRSFFHRAFAWFGERTRFAGIHGYGQFSPSGRVLQPGEVYILDVAPIYRGYISDIGYTASLGDNPELERANAFLSELRDEIPGLFRETRSAKDVWDRIDASFASHGYDCIHRLYPFSVLGHRVHHKVTERANVGLMNFGWQSYWELASRGLFGQLLNRDYRGDLRGLWAIEPHLGGKGFGAKFEEILVVTDDNAFWLAD